jgi:hypothetical protein
MKDDENFFNQFQEEPRPEFAAALYKRIHKPMLTNTKQNTLRRMAFTFAVITLLIVALMAYSPVRVQAFNWLRQIGIFTITTEQPLGNLPTALPPDQLAEPVTATSAQEASKLVGFGVLEPQSLPEGYQTAGYFNITGSQDGTIVVTSYTHPQTSAFVLINQYKFDESASYTNNVTGTETVQDVTVRNQPGVWITGRMMTNPLVGHLNADTLNRTNWLLWEENGVAYSVISDGLTIEEALQLAQSFK